MTSGWGVGVGDRRCGWRLSGLGSKQWWSCLAVAVVVVVVKQEVPATTTVATTSGSVITRLPHPSLLYHKYSSITTNDTMHGRHNEQHNSHYVIGNKSPYRPPRRDHRPPSRLAPSLSTATFITAAVNTDALSRTARRITRPRR